MPINERAIANGNGLDIHVRDFDSVIAAKILNLFDKIDLGRHLKEKESSTFDSVNDSDKYLDESVNKFLQRIVTGDYMSKRVEFLGEQFKEGKAINLIDKLDFSLVTQALKSLGTDWNPVPGRLLKRLSKSKMCLVNSAGTVGCLTGPSSSEKNGDEIVIFSGMSANKDSISKEMISESLRKYTEDEFGKDHKIRMEIADSPDNLESIEGLSPSLASFARSMLSEMRKQGLSV